MLQKKKRITKEYFQEIMKKGRMVSSPLFVLRFLPQKPPQFAFIAPKTVAKKAVLRNKLRRQGYSVLREIALPPLGAIFFYKKQAKQATFNEIKSDMLNLLNKVKPL